MPRSATRTKRLIPRSPTVSEGDRDSVAVEEEPELHDGLPAVFLADAELPQPRDYVPVRVLEVLVRPCGLEEEVRHVVEHGVRAPSDAAGDAGVHALYYLPSVRVDDVERVVDVVGVRALDERGVVLAVLPHRRPLRLRVYDPPVGQQPHDPREVVLDARGALDAREELVEAERAEDGVEHARRHPLRLADALRVAALVRDRPLAHGRLVHVRLEFLDERPAFGEGLAQPLQVVGPAVVVLRKCAEAEDDSLADYRTAQRVPHPLPADETQIGATV